jgi:hypothetical protein
MHATLAVGCATRLAAADLNTSHWRDLFHPVTTAPLGPRRHPLGNSSPSSGGGRSRCPPSMRSRTCASSKSCAEEQGYHARCTSAYVSHRWITLLVGIHGSEAVLASAPAMSDLNQDQQGHGCHEHPHSCHGGGHRRRVPQTPHQHFRLWPRSATRCSFLGVFFYCRSTGSTEGMERATRGRVGVGMRCGDETPVGILFGSIDTFFIVYVLKK